MNSAMALPIIAMRMRMAMQRHARQSVDTTRLLADQPYADEVLQACRALGLPEVTALADQFDAARKGQPAAPAAAAAPLPPTATPLPIHPLTQPLTPPPPPLPGGPAPASHSPRLSPAVAPSTRPPPGAAPSTGGYASTGPSTNGDSEPHDPNDPHNPRTRRYLRGAR